MLIRQPNGKLCLCDWRGKVEMMNLTEEDYVEYCANKAREFVNDKANIKNFGELIRLQKVTDEELKEMGSDKTYAELLKYVPLEPNDQHYVSVNCATYGKCPTCGESVQDGIGLTHHQCPKCNQRLEW